MLVDKCDYLSTVGWGNGGADARKKLGIPGGGPKFCVTPLCIMDFTETEKRMRLRSTHPGVSIEQVINNTGFDLVIPDHVPTTSIPTQEELKVLRTRVDTTGFLKTAIS